MKTIEQIPHNSAASDFGCEYFPVVIEKSDSEKVYGIAAQNRYDNKLLSVKEIGADKERTVSIIDTLNGYRVPYVHFLDVVNDLMNE